jgi:alpha-1,2-rhamnosyltransferase
MEFPDEPTVYVDVTQMMGNRRQTGIQRVVRELARVGPAVASQFRRNCRLVHVVGSQFYRLRFEHIDHEQRAWLFRLAERRLGRRLLRAAWPLASKPVLARSGDVLLTLNATWDVPDWFEAVAEFRRTGFVASVLYDLTPLSHPQFHTADLSQRFQVWLDKLARNTDHWIGISRHVAGELTRYLNASASNSESDRQPTVSAFRLGSELGRKSRPDVGQGEFAQRPGGAPFALESSVPTEVRPSLAAFLAADAPTLLMVGTLEPRKNHLATLTACRELWRQGWQGQLLLIGRPGWQHSAVLQAIADMPREKLFWLADASDAELQVAYQSSALLVFPSWEEGFGLPIVEALTYGTPVLASDHPVHREVGGQACQYFPADAPAELARLIQVATTDNFQALRHRANHFHALSWEQSCRQLLADAILASSRHLANLRQPQSSRGSLSRPTIESHGASPTLAAPANTRAA